MLEEIIQKEAKINLEILKKAGILKNFYLAGGTLYFEDAEKDPIPRMIVVTSWRDVKKFFEEEVKETKII